jgi:drug/metabolite transporter (DMT)-like permease
MRLAVGSERRTYVLLVLMVLAASSGNVLLGKGMKQAGGISVWSPAGAATLFVKAFANYCVWLGIGCLLLFLVSFMVVLSWADYSFVSPASSASYVTTALMSHWLLGEIITAERWAGVALISLGVVLVTGTPFNTRIGSPIRE